MNIENLTTSIWKSQIENNALVWYSHSYKNCLNELLDIIKNKLHQYSLTDPRKSIFYNYCVIQLDKIINYPRNTTNLQEYVKESQKYFLYLLQNKDDLNLDNITDDFYFLILNYLSCASFYKSQNVLSISNELLDFLINKINESFFTSKDEVLSCFCKALIRRYSLVDYQFNQPYQNDMFKIDCDLFLSIFDKLYKNLASKNDKKILIKKFLTFQSCPFYKNRYDNVNNIKKAYCKINFDNNLNLTRMSQYKESLFQFAEAMKNKKYYEIQMNKFQNENDVLNSIVWSNKYYKEIIKICEQCFFNNEYF